MSSTASLLRRTAFILSIAAILGAVLAWRRDRLGPAGPESPPEWPEFITPVPGSNGAAATPATPAAPAAQSGGGESAAWVAPRADGSCPPDHTIKAKESSGIYHVPEGRFYGRTNPDRCYATEAGAEADGYRRSKS
jgi:hypothetical protein